MHLLGQLVLITLATTSACLGGNTQQAGPPTLFPIPPFPYKKHEQKREQLCGRTHKSDGDAMETHNSMHEIPTYKQQSDGHPTFHHT